MYAILFFLSIVGVTCKLTILYNHISKDSERYVKGITCGTVLKLVNAEFDARLHSHEVQYGSGSEQQSVTAVGDKIDSNSYWQILERSNSPHCARGRVIKCGQKIRIMHLNTKKNLHSHHFKSPLSNNYEVSAFGSDGLGDEGDDWQVICDGSHWQRDTRIRLKHISTEGYLHLSGKRYNRPIAGQYEVCAVSGSSKASQWIAAEGIYVKEMSEGSTNTSASEEHDEL